MNTIYISSYLSKVAQGYPVAKQLLALDVSGKVKVIEIPDNRNEWCRDYMPVRSAKGNLVLFKYWPHYLSSSKSGLASIPDQNRICKNLGLHYEDATDIILDGGAIEMHKSAAIVSRKFLELNGDVEDVKEALRVRLGLNEVIDVLPDPWDFTGHVDGLVRFIDERNVLVNDHSELEISIAKESKYIQKKYWNWKRQFDETLQRATLRVHVLPSAFHLNQSNSSAKGIYLNFLLLRHCILMPSFNGLEQYNEAAAKHLETLYQREVLQIEACGIAAKGGVINCVTWQLG
jgi:agmatine deiminase